MVTVLILAKYQPFEETEQNRLELFNDYTIFGCAIALCNFTPYLALSHTGGVELSKLRTLIGWIVIALICLMILVNQVFLLKNIYYKIKYKIIVW